MLPAGEEESSHFEILPEYFILLNMDCPQDKLFYQSLTDLGKGKNQLQPLPASKCGKGNT